jgi:hypothetical protein
MNYLPKLTEIPTLNIEPQLANSGFYRVCENCTLRFGSGVRTGKNERRSPACWGPQVAPVLGEVGWMEPKGGMLGKAEIKPGPLGTAVGSSKSV